MDASGKKSVLPFSFLHWSLPDKMPPGYLSKGVRPKGGFIHSKSFIPSRRWKYLRVSGKEKTDIALRLWKAQLLKRSNESLGGGKKVKLLTRDAVLKRKGKRLNNSREGNSLSTVDALFRGSGPEKRCT